MYTWLYPLVRNTTFVFEYIYAIQSYKHFELYLIQETLTTINTLLLLFWIILHKSSLNVFFYLNQKSKKCIND